MIEINLLKEPGLQQLAALLPSFDDEEALSEEAIIERLRDRRTIVGAAPDIVKTGNIRLGSVIVIILFALVIYWQYARPDISQWFEKSL